MQRVVLIAAAATLGLACGASTETPTATATAADRLVVTERHHGKTFVLRKGRTGTLLLAAGARGRVVAQGRSVLAIRVESYAPTGRQQYELRAVRAGTTTISAPRKNGTRFRFTVRVP